MDSNRRTVLATGSAATAMAAVPHVFAQQVAQGASTMSFYEKGNVRIHFEEAGSGFPLLLIAGGGLNSTIANFTRSNSPFDPVAEFKGEYRCIAADLRNANGGQSTGPLVWNLLKRAPDRIVAAVLAQPSGSRPEMRGLFYEGNMKTWGPELVKNRTEITMETVDKFLTKMY